jgi:hypothetical protein
MKRLFFLLSLSLSAWAQTTVTLKGSSYNLLDGPVGLLDGPCAMGAWASGTNYHDLEAVSFSGTWYRAIAQSGPSTVGAITPGTNTAYWVASGNNLTGSGATYTCLLWGTSGSGKAQTSNPAYVASKAGADNYIATGFSTSAGGDQGNNSPGQSSGNNYAASFNCALQWAAEGAPDLGNDSAGYLACALNSIVHAEDFNYGTFFCDQTMGTCGAYGAQADFGSYWTPWLATTYSIVRNQLTSGQRTTFNNKIWNDNSSSNNGLGLNGNTSGTCTPLTPLSISGTISTVSYSTFKGGGATLLQSETVVGVGTSFTTDLAVGDIIGMGYGGHVASITDNTHLLLAAPGGFDGSGIALNTVAGLPWVDANNYCGLVWFLKHHPSSPQVGTGTYTTSYPTAGGTFVGGFINLTITKLSGYMPLALATAGDDARARTALTQYFDWYYDNTWAYIQQDTTGYMRPRGYTLGRNHWMLTEIVLSVQDSVPGYNTAPLKGYWALGQMPFEYLPSENDQLGGWGLAWNGGTGSGSGYQLPGSPEASQVNYWQKTTRADYSAVIGFNPYTVQLSSQQAPMLFIYTDPGNAGTSPASITTQYIFDRTDLNPTGGPSASVTKCNYQNTVNGNDCRFNMLVSRSGFGATDSIVFQQNYFYDGQDHQGERGPAWLALTIYRQDYLLAGDGTVGDADVFPVGLTALPVNDATIQIGAGSNWQVADDVHGWASSEIRWAGAHPDGVASSKYAYAMHDANGTYVTTVTHALREVAHLKGGSQDYVIVHDYVSVPSGTTIQSNWPLYFGPEYPFGRTSTVTSSSWASSQTAQDVGASASLIMKAVLVAGANTLATIDPGAGTYAHPLTLCASTNGTSCNSSATSMESVMVLKPANTVSPSMPTLTQLTCSGCAVVQVADGAAPKVAAFVSGASTVTSMSFTSTHSGTAQYVLAGITAGAYNVTVGGTPVTGSPFTVNAGDNTVYFENAAGAVSLSATGASAPTVTTTTATSITSSSATAGGVVTSNGGASVTSEGTCYATSATPTSPCTSDGTATPFTSSISGLAASTTYHYRAFATNSAGTSYGSDLTFTTSGSSSGGSVTGGNVKYGGNVKVQ